MTPELQILERVHKVETAQATHTEKLINLDSWVTDIHKTLKGVEYKVTLGVGGLLAIELFFKIWGK
jgi:hypothetical protein